MMNKRKTLENTADRLIFFEHKTAAQFFNLNSLKMQGVLLKYHLLIGKNTVNATVL